MTKYGKLAAVMLTASLSGSLAYADPVPALAPQAIPPDALKAIDAANQAALANQGSDVPLLDSHVLSVGLGSLVGVLAYCYLFPSGAVVARAMPTAVTRRMAVAARGTAAIAPFPFASSAVVGALAGDYLYRKNNTGRLPSVSSDVAGRVKP